MAKNTICVWYDRDAEAAAHFYANTFPDSRVGAVTRAPIDNPGNKKSDVLTVEFTVAGVACVGLNGGTMFIGAMTRHDEFLCHWIESASQTNEVGRSGVIIAAAHWLHTNFGLPLKLSELGASAGLNLLFDKYTLQIGKRYWGSREATVRLTPGWQGNLPPLSQPHIVERRGVDLSPLRAGHPEDELRLISYIWADQTNRIKRARAALAFSPPQVDKADAIEWLPNRLAVPWFGSMHLI